MNKNKKTAVKKIKAINEGKSQQPKKNNSVSIVLFVVSLVILIVTYIFASKIFGENSVFNQTISNNAFINETFAKIPAIIETYQIVVIAITIHLILSVILKKLVSKNKRASTISKLISSFLKYLTAIIALLAVLGAWGVNTTTILASAGILTLVVGLGAQSLVADIVAGVFIVFEGEYEVGDIVVIDNWRGTVTEIGIRTTKIVDAGGNVKIINNSEIKSVINQTQDLSLATCEVGIEYNESIERVEAIINKNIATMAENIPAILDGPYYKGVKALNSSSVDLLFMARCKEEDIYQVQRDMNREVKLMFDRNNINIPFPQIVLNNAVKANLKYTDKKTTDEAKIFVEEQKILSKNIEEQES